MQPQSPSNPLPPAQDTTQPADLPAVQADPAVFTPPAHLGAPAQPAASQPALTPAPAVADVSAPAMADDGDLIEKEWVVKVRQIVQATAHDPFEQSRQFTILKADYLQKRYGKSIKSEY